MYFQKIYHQGDRDVCLDHIRRYSFGTLITTVDGVPFATHLPFLVDATRGEHGTLVAHMARANPHWRGFGGGAESLAVFLGPHAYVSPSWYASAENVVPTWDYATVHAYGSPAPVEDPDAVRGLLERTVAEAEAGAAQPWRLASQADDYLQGMARGIVAFEMPIARLESRFKLSQNRTEADRLGAAAGLEASGDPMAAEVARMIRATR